MAAARHRAAGARLARALGRGRDARSRRRWQRRSPTSQPSADLSPGRRAARRRLVGAHAAKPLPATSWHRITCSRRCAAPACTPRVLVTSSAIVYTPVDRAITEDDVRPAEQPVRHQQARAGNGGAAGVGRRRHPGADRAGVQPHRAAAVAVVRGAEHREADRADRSGPAAAGARGRQPRAEARHHGRARHRARVSRDDGVGEPGVPYNVCSGTPVPIRTLVERSCGAGARADRDRTGPGAVPAERHAAGARRSQPAHARHRLDAADPARADGRRSARLLATVPLSQPQFSRVLATA